jgi:hypothetical protein
VADENGVGGAVRRTAAPREAVGPLRVSGVVEVIVVKVIRPGAASVTRLKERPPAART